ncbi:glutaredoxin 3 [Rhodothalassium salexigens DSM 2132]|uniref:Glutaredoxin n=1 Tax=Rhodothalassium salexigens DSM 2132 TaxID=1188247 RepID=A0A4R2PIT7_RHOSA|nr:glutaredoxin 3 [Rhodothalassium salexigens]MBB4211470.1 glutaredoxin 3 [Rhodothalassium salexigens DSM 2132]MBK1640025.1 glutaredoxin 3 [Rhodothalassium salexigens DSM 2132]TCP35390.1 glutaredoxin 3 [Rhodothalassium salexigens DSM 2132]
MADVEIYTKEFCGFCARAKKLLRAKNVGFKEIPIDMEPRRRPEMIERAGGKTTVPQIFIGGEHVGGCDELVALDRAGKLDALLEA